MERSRQWSYVSVRVDECGPKPIKPLFRSNTRGYQAWIVLWPGRSSQMVSSCDKTPKGRPALPNGPSQHRCYALTEQYSSNASFRFPAIISGVRPSIWWR